MEPTGSKHGTLDFQSHTPRQGRPQIPTSLAGCMCSKPSNAKRDKVRFGQTINFCHRSHLCDNFAVALADHALNGAATTVQVMVAACLQKLTIIS